VIVTLTPFIRTDMALKPMFFYRTLCECHLDIYQAAYREKDVSQFWFHEDTESEFCYRASMNKAEPVFGPVNLELYWMG